MYLYLLCIRYVGEFSKNLKSGHGVYTFPDGRVYEGPFVDDRMSFNDGSLEEKVATRGPILIDLFRSVFLKSQMKFRVFALDASNLNKRKNSPP